MIINTSESPPINNTFSVSIKEKDAVVIGWKIKTILRIKETKI